MVLGASKIGGLFLDLAYLTTLHPTRYDAPRLHGHLDILRLLLVGGLNPSEKY